MESDAVIHIDFDHAITPSRLVSALMDAGWGASDDGVISVLSPTIFGQMRNWKKLEGAGRLSFLNWAESHDKGKRGLGFSLVHQATGIGGPMTIGKGRRSLDWTIRGNVPYLFADCATVDVSKCLSIIFPAINLVSNGYFEVKAQVVVGEEESMGSPISRPVSSE